MRKTRGEKQNMKALTVRLRQIVDADCADVHVKLEYFNPTGGDIT